MSNPAAFLGILNVQTVAYAGFALLGIFLLVVIIWGLINLSTTGDLLTILVTALSGVIVLFLAYTLIYNIANTSNEIIVTDAHIINLRICGNNSLPCITEGLTQNDISLYWEVQGGVGCCNTFNCNYQAFTAFCGSPFDEYNLYTIALDGVVTPWGNYVQWDYECSYNTPWNYFNYENITLGIHNITILQKDCRIVVDILTIYFNLSGGNGTYAIQQI